MGFLCEESEFHRLLLSSQATLQGSLMVVVCTSQMRTRGPRGTGDLAQRCEAREGDQDPVCLQLPPNKTQGARSSQMMLWEGAQVGSRHGRRGEVAEGAFRALSPSRTEDGI